MRWSDDGIIYTMDMSLKNLGDSEGQGVWHVSVHGVTKNWA